MGGDVHVRFKYQHQNGEEVKSQLMPTKHIRTFNRGTTEISFQTPRIDENAKLDAGGKVHAQMYLVDLDDGRRNSMMWPFFFQSQPESNKRKKKTSPNNPSTGTLAVSVQRARVESGSESESASSYHDRNIESNASYLSTCGEESETSPVTSSPEEKNPTVRAPGTARNYKTATSPQIASHFKNLVLNNETESSNGRGSNDETLAQIIRDLISPTECAPGTARNYETETSPQINIETVSINEGASGSNTVPESSNGLGSSDETLEQILDDISPEEHWWNNNATKTNIGIESDNESRSDPEGGPGLNTPYVSADFMEYFRKCTTTSNVEFDLD